MIASFVDAFTHRNSRRPDCARITGLEERRLTGDRTSPQRSALGNRVVGPSYLSCPVDADEPTKLERLALPQSAIADPPQCRQIVRRQSFGASRFILRVPRGSASSVVRDTLHHRMAEPFALEVAHPNGEFGL
jgi:hypothetical protein